METIVPEDTLGAGDELEALVLKLAGNSAFAMCRHNRDQRFYWHLSDIIERMIRDSASPTAFCVAFDEYFGAVRVVGNILAQLRRDGRNRAYHEMLEALQKEDFLFTHESVPLESTTPVTVLMLEPARTLVMMKWMAEARTAELLAFVGIQGRWQRLGWSVQSITEKLFGAFPTLEKRTREGHAAGQDNGQELSAAYGDALAGLPNSFEGALPFMTDRYRQLIETSETGGSSSMFIFPLAFLFIGRRQDEVLSMLDRGAQDRVATWQLHVPTLSLRYNSTFEYINIGFHPEAEHGVWAKKLPSFTSAGVSHGHGVMFLGSGTASHETAHEYKNEVRVTKAYDPSSYSYGLKEGCAPRLLLQICAGRGQCKAAYKVFKGYLGESSP
ncbi:MAG: hypothetical protein KGH68_00965 [Patescibacteria group bacterium]|nr:hypothetical protein [Patescibacteria group bacterium]